jgi:hypothetical protein
VSFGDNSINNTGELQEPSSSNIFKDDVAEPEKIYDNIAESLQADNHFLNGKHGNDLEPELKPD